MSPRKRPHLSPSRTSNRRPSCTCSFRLTVWSWSPAFYLPSSSKSSFSGCSSCIGSAPFFFLDKSTSFFHGPIMRAQFQTQICHKLTWWPRESPWPWDRLLFSPTAWRQSEKITSGSRATWKVCALSAISIPQSSRSLFNVLIFVRGLVWMSGKRSGQPNRHDMCTKAFIMNSLQCVVTTALEKWWWSWSQWRWWSREQSPHSTYLPTKFFI